MESTNISKNEKDIKSKDELKNLKSDYFLKNIIDYLKANVRKAQKKLGVAAPSFLRFFVLMDILLHLHYPDSSFLQTPDTSKLLHHSLPYHQP